MSTATVAHPIEEPLKQLELSAGSTISYHPHWISTAEADELLQQLLITLNWQHGKIRMFGKWLPIPRRHVWYGDAQASYGWSGQRAEPQPWTPLLLELRNRLQAHCNSPFNGCLANLYRDGEDCMHWHADNEAELGPQPTVAAISLGAERRFALRHNQREHPSHRLRLAHGSLLLMRGDCQQHWQHALPRSKRIDSPRISLTFRQIQRPPLVKPDD